MLVSYSTCPHVPTMCAVDPLCVQTSELLLTDAACTAIFISMDACMHTALCVTPCLRFPSRLHLYHPFVDIHSSSS